ncbi:MAG: hypothetical protein DMF26_17295 [Verrucomicrobia bacterium]|nr:MAG: hypothetical protein DMF26_17295 [Verrucomicrobiota bacterium]
MHSAKGADLPPAWGNAPGRLRIPTSALKARLTVFESRFQHVIIIDSNSWARPQAYVTRAPLAQTNRLVGSGCHFTFRN